VPRRRSAALAPEPAIAAAPRTARGAHLAPTGDLDAVDVIVTDAGIDAETAGYPRFADKLDIAQAVA
jgi:hypothetical protein